MSEKDDIGNEYGKFSLILLLIAVISYTLIEISMFFLGFIIALLVSYLSFVIGYAGEKRGEEKTWATLGTLFGLLMTLWCIFNIMGLIMFSGGIWVNDTTIGLFFYLIIFIIFSCSTFSFLKNPENIELLRKKILKSSKKYGRLYGRMSLGFGVAGLLICFFLYIGSTISFVYATLYRNIMEIRLITCLIGFFITFLGLLTGIFGYLGLGGGYISTFKYGILLGCINLFLLLLYFRQIMFLF